MDDYTFPSFNDLDSLASSEPLEPSPPPPPDETNEQRARRLAKKHGVDPNLAVAIMAQESRGKTKATSWKKAGGPMQLMPATAKSLGVTDLYDPEQNIEAGIKYLKQGLDKYGRTPEGIKKALAGYNLGMEHKWLQRKDWWNKIAYASNSRDVQEGRKPRGPSDKTSTQVYVKNIYSNYMAGGSGGTKMNYNIISLEDLGKLAAKQPSLKSLGKPPKTQPGGVPPVETATTAVIKAPVVAPAQVPAATTPQPAPQPALEDLSKLAVGSDPSSTEQPPTPPATENDYQQWREFMKIDDTSESRQQFQMALVVAPNTGRTEVTGAGIQGIVDKDVTEAKDIDGKSTSLSEYAKQTQLPDGTIIEEPKKEIGGDTNDLGRLYRTVRLPDTITDPREAAIRAMMTVEGVDEEKASRYIDSLPTPLTSKWKPGGGINIRHVDLKGLGATDVLADIQMQQTQNRVDNTNPLVSSTGSDWTDGVEAKSTINRIRGISPEQEQKENLEADPLYQKARRNIAAYTYPEDVGVPSIGEYGDLSKPLDEKEVLAEYGRLRTNEGIKDEEAIRSGIEKGQNMGAIGGGITSALSGGMNFITGAAQVLGKLGGGSGESDITRYLRRIGLETGAAASAESEKNTGLVNTVLRTAAGLPGNLTRVMLLVPSGAGGVGLMLGFGTEAAISSYGSGASGEEQAKSFVLGAASAATFPLGKVLGTVAGGGKAGTFIKSLAIGTGSAAVAATTDPDHALQAGLENVILDGIMAVARMRMRPTYGVDPLGRNRQTGMEWYDSGKPDMAMVKNKIFSYTDKTFSAPQYFEVKADGKIVVVSRPPEGTKVTYITKPPTPAEIESAIRKQIKPGTTDTNPQGPSMSEPGRQFIPAPVSDLGPIPETQTAIDAHSNSAKDPGQTERIAVMYAGEQAKDAPKATAKEFKLVAPNGDVILVDRAGWKLKAKELGVPGTKDGLVLYTKAGADAKAVQTLLGRKEVVSDTSQGVAVEAQVDGKQVDAAVVTSPEAAIEQAASYEAQHPDAQVEVKPTEEVAVSRIADHVVDEQAKNDGTARAQEAATSELNDLPQPTQEQIAEAKKEIEFIDDIANELDIDVEHVAANIAKYGLHGDKLDHRNGLWYDSKEDQDFNDRISRIHERYDENKAAEKSLKKIQAQAEPSSSESLKPDTATSSASKVSASEPDPVKRASIKFQEDDYVQTPEGPGYVIKQEGRNVHVELLDNESEVVYLDRLVTSAKPPDVAAEYGASNKYFTKERNEQVSAEIRARVKADERTARIGFDPELLRLAIERGGFHIEAGARSFVEFSRRMVDEFGNAIRPYLNAAYSAIRDMPGFDNEGMDPRLADMPGDGLRKIRASVPHMEAAGLTARDAVTGQYRYYDVATRDIRVENARGIINHIGIDAAVEIARNIRGDHVTLEDSYFQGQTLRALRNLEREAVRAGSRDLAARYREMQAQVAEAAAEWGTNNAQLQESRRAMYDDPVEGAVLEVERARDRRGLGELTPEEKQALEDAADAYEEAKAAVDRANADYDANPIEALSIARQEALKAQQKAFDALDALEKHLKNEPTSIPKKIAQLYKMAMVSAETTAANNMASATATRALFRVRDIIDLGIKKAAEATNKTFLKYLIPNADARGSVPARGEKVFYRDAPTQVISVDKLNGTVKLYIRGKAKEVPIDDVERQPEGMSAKTRWADVAGIPIGAEGGFTAYFRQTYGPGPIIQMAMREYPELYSQLYGDYQSDIQEVSQIREDPGGVVHKTLDAGIWAYDKANWFNRTQEYYNRNLQVMYALQLRLGSRGLNLADMEAKKDFRKVTKEDWEYAIKEARRVSYALQPKEGTYSRKLIDWTRTSGALPAVFVAPFANFSWNVFNMTSDFMPLLAQIKAGKRVIETARKDGYRKSDALKQVFRPDKYTSTELANSMLGFGLLATTYALVKELGDKRNANLMKIPYTEGMAKDGKDSLYLDVRTHPQFYPFVFVAHKLNRLFNGEDLFDYSDKKAAVSEIVDAFASQSVRTSIDDNAAVNSVYYGAQALFEKMKATAGGTDPIDIDRNREKAAYALMQFFGNYTGVFLQPAKPLKFLFDSAAGTPDKNFNNHPFLQAFSRNLPKSVFGSAGYAPVEDAENYATGDKKFKRFEPFKAMGLSIVDGTEIGDRMTAGELTAARLARNPSTGDKPFLPDDKLVADIRRDFEKESDRRRATGDSSGLEELERKVETYVKSGVLTADAAERIRANIITSDLQENFSKITVVPRQGEKYSDAELVWGKLSPEEKGLLKPALDKKIATALADNKIPEFYLEKLKIFATPESISAIAAAGKAKATQEQLEQDMIDAALQGDTSKIDALPLKDRNRLLKTTKTSASTQEFMKLGVPQRVFFFANQPPESQAELLPYLEKVSASLASKTSEADVVTKKEIARLIQVYNAKLNSATPQAREALTKITEKARQDLTSASPAKLPSSGINLPTFSIPTPKFD